MKRTIHSLLFAMRFCALALVMVALAPVAHAEDSFRIEDIRLEGLQRVSPGTVFAALPLNVGDIVDTAVLQSATQTLFKSGYFDDIHIGRDGQVLVITVVERPAVASIAIDGNKAIETEQLLDVLKNAGLAEGLIFKRTILEVLAMEMERQYVAQGRYGASVVATVETLPQNRVAVAIKIKEGSVSAIKHINIIGNSKFDKDQLLGLFEQETTGFWSWANNRDKYSKEKLEGDIERLKSWYLDRGYLRFKVDSTQVSLSPDRESIYIVVNITEGEQYQVSKVDLAGELKVPEDHVRRLLLLAPDMTFSQALMTKSSERIKLRLGNEGYTEAEVKEITDINDEAHTVDVTFYVNPQERNYVRRIDFRGNTKTIDEVLRREMRQMEGGLATSYKIEQSKVRLERLGFFRKVEMETVEVPGTGDQIDLQYTVEEQPSGSIGASIGFAQGTGAILGANIQQDNFLGTGKSVGFNLSTSSYSTEFSFNYFDPYYTPDGISRGLKLYYVARDYDEANIANYSVDSYGIDVNFGYPISEIEDVGYGLGYGHTEVTVGNAAAQEIAGSPVLDAGITSYVGLDCVNEIVTALVPADVSITCGIWTDPFNFTMATTALPATPNAIYVDTPEGFIDRYGDVYDNFVLTASWRQSLLNRGRLATRGYSQSVSGEITVPGSDLEFWKVNYKAQYFVPLTRHLTLRLRTRLGYGDGYGNTDELPFYENYFSGGFGSIRGYKRNTIGPHSTPARGYYVFPAAVTAGVVSTNAYVCDPDVATCTNQLSNYLRDDAEGDPFGGNMLVEGGAEIIFPMPFVKDQRSLQPAFFVEGGTVFDTSCTSTQLNCFDFDPGEFRYSAGVGLTWITMFGPMMFSFAKAIGENEYDETEFFQFSLGQLF